MIAALRGLPRRETALLAVALAALIVVGIASERAKAPVEIASYSTYDAATGGYRAAYELLARLGVRVARFEHRPAFLDASVATLAYVDPLAFDPRQRAPTEADLAALESWVRAGGVLLYVGDDDAAAARGTLRLPRVVDGRARRPYVAPELAVRGVARVRSAQAKRYAVRVRGARVLVADDRGALVVATPLGRGRVVAVVDRELFANDGIATGDRARLFAALATLAPRDGTFAFDELAHGHAIPEHWWLVVPRGFAVAVLGGAFVLLVALAGAAWRLGPPLVPPARDDRSSAEFIDALATLYERRAVARETLLDVARATTTALARATGARGAATVDAIARALPDARDRAALHELHALAARPHVRDGDLVRGVALAHRLRRDHVAHDRSSH